MEQRRRPRRGARRRAALGSPDIQSRFTTLGTETVDMPPDEFTRVFHGDLE